MPRPCKARRVGHQPAVTVYKPVGAAGSELGVTELGLDELEALRLADVAGLYQEDAAGHMGVSRPTFTRLLQAARHKVADALLHGKSLIVKGGAAVTAPMRTFQCQDCGQQFEEPFGTGRPPACRNCNSANIFRVDELAGRGRRRRGAPWQNSPGTPGPATPDPTAPDAEIAPGMGAGGNRGRGRGQGGGGGRGRGQGRAPGGGGGGRGRGGRRARSSDGLPPKMPPGNPESRSE